MKITRGQAEWVLLIHDRWRGMRKRCVPGTSKSKHHGDKGIRVCKKWDTDFWQFFQWALDTGFRPELTLGRKRNSGNYCPSNCSWETYEEQNRNKTNNVLVVSRVANIKWLLKHDKSPSAIAKYYNVSRGVIQEIDRNRNWKSVISKKPQNYRQLSLLPNRIKRQRKVFNE